MIDFQKTADAAFVYRETSAVSTLRMDGTGNTGTLLDVIRDAVVVVGPPAEMTKVPGSPKGTIEAVKVG
jgi:hypothetical protein